ncbi:hypothetical protein SteCoe_23509 [Stentor coeruleus]|uniref:Casein kinase I n=1 Tax=Stentor coeruleus TaxID=5963 RepID=A0A1R2BJP4_9CILI|nr:hypothetical protein SteCoe_23509 [Stentor coeruleus]
MQIEFDKTILERYYIKDEVGTGSFGKVYKLQHLTKNKSFALKVDIRQKGSVLLEAKILADLQGGVGIPKLYKYGSTDQFSYMIVELLGPTLNKLLKQCKGKFSLATVISIMLQLITRIEYVHRKGYLHRDLKPHQVLVGKNPKIVYLTDFGLARKFEVNNYHISFQNSCPRVGNATFSSLNNHSGVRQSRRDDLESMAYMALYFLKGHLPWQSTQRINSNTKWQNIFQIKNHINIENLCFGCPKEFSILLKYCRNLKFEEKPDYNYIQSLFLQIQKRENLYESFFDWIEDEKSLRSPTTICEFSQSLSISNNIPRCSTINVENTRVGIKDEIKDDMNDKRRKKNRARTQTQMIIKKNKKENMLNIDIKIVEQGDNQLSSKTWFDESTYNSLDVTPKNIYPEIKNRKAWSNVLKVKKDKKICKVF